MTGHQNDEQVLTAQILTREAGRPIQVKMTAHEAEDLAYIAKDFASAIVQDNDEARRMVAFATMLAARLEDCVAARVAIAA